MAAGSSTIGLAVWSSSLYVGDLDKFVDEYQLYNIFVRVAPVVSIRVCRDKDRRVSLGYAYVNFTNRMDAANAREKLNFSPINGKPMRIMFSHRDPSMRKSGFANLFIKNLDKSVDNKALFDTFSSFGYVLSCKVVTNSSGQSKGFGFVQFDHKDAAERAIQNMNGMLINRKKVYVAYFVRRDIRNMEEGSSKFTNVYVKNFPQETTDSELKSMFSKFGRITSYVIMRDGNENSRGFGFVCFESSECAAAAVEIMNGLKVNDEKILYVARAQKKSERKAQLRAQYEQERNRRFPKDANLYMKNLDDNFTEETLLELFSKFGIITSCKVIRDARGASQCYGFVAFANAEEASKALKEMNGKLVGRKPLYVAIAQRKEERKVLLEAEFAHLGNRHMQHGFYPTSVLSTQQFYYVQGMTSSLFPNQQVSSYGHQQPFIHGIQSAAASYLFSLQYQQAHNGPHAGSRQGVTYQPSHHQQWLLRNNGARRYVPVGTNIGITPVYSLANPVIHVTRDGGSSLPASQPPGSTVAAEMPENTRKILGDKLFLLVDNLVEPELTGKITGMLLEMDHTELLHLIRSPNALKKKVEEALMVFRSASASDVNTNYQRGN